MANYEQAYIFFSLLLVKCEQTGFYSVKLTGLFGYALQMNQLKIDDVNDTPQSIDRNQQILFVFVSFTATVVK